MPRLSAPEVRRVLRRLGRGVARAAQLPPRELLTTVHVVALISVAEVLIRWVSLPRLSRLFGMRLDFGPAQPDAQPVAASELSPVAVRQLRCTRRVADTWPFGQGPCLRQSLVAGHFLRGEHPALRLGMAGTDSDLLAHAWVEIDGRPLEHVAGYMVFQRVPTEYVG